MSWLLDHIAQLVVDALNALIAALAAVLAAAVSLLPDMPALPTMPTPFGTAYAWVAWFFPVGTVVDALAFVLVMFLLWQGIAIALRWAKALNE